MSTDPRARCEQEIAEAIAHQQAHGPDRENVLWEMDWREELQCIGGVILSEAKEPYRAENLRAPFPWFGGKSRVAHIVWQYFGNVPNYVEPFAGSLAVLLGRPHTPRTETVNDLTCMVANFWRALQHAPDEVARHCDYPVNEADLHARHRWAIGRAEFRERMKWEPDYYDAKIAGWWVWGISADRLWLV